MSNERRDRTLQLTKRIATSIDTKNGINQAAQELQERIKSALEGYEQNISVGLLEQSAVAADILELKRAQKILEGGTLLSRIKHLPEVRPEDTNPEDPNRDKIIEERNTEKEKIIK